MNTALIGRIKRLDKLIYFKRQNTHSITAVVQKTNIILVFLAILMVFSGCYAFGRGDWKYDLPNQYQVLMVNSHDIVIRNCSEGIVINNTIVHNYILSFCYNDRFVGVQRIVPDDPDHCYIQERYSKDPEYYIIDTEENMVLGPFNEAEYEEMCDNLNVAALCEWIKTDPMPDGAYY